MTIKLISSAPEKREANTNSRPQIFEDMKRLQNTPHAKVGARCRKFLKSLSDDGFDESMILRAVLNELEGNAVASKETDDFKWEMYRKYKTWKNYSPPS